MLTKDIHNNIERWTEEQMFEEDVRAVLLMMRPHRRERLQGWSEYRTGGAHFRATISWDEEFEHAANDEPLAVPRMADVLLGILVGSLKNDEEVPVPREFEHYRAVIRELHCRVDEMQSGYE